MSQVRDELSVHPCARIPDHLEGVMSAEFRGDFLAAQVNWLENYTTCTEILAKISRAIRFDPQRPTPQLAYNYEQWTAYGQNLVERLLLLADNFSNKIDDGLGFVATHCVKGHAKEAIRMALEANHCSICIAESPS